MESFYGSSNTGPRACGTIGIVPDAEALGARPSRHYEGWLHPAITRSRAWPFGVRVDTDVA